MAKFSIPKPVFYLGIASLLSDIASEAVYPVLPFFLTTTLGASVLFVGVLEGVVEAVSSLLKLVSGYYSDKWKKREPFVISGYLISNLLRPMLGFSFTALQVFGIRFGDRIGKGIRTAPRDAWLAAHTTPKTRGRIFGFHRGMDNAGATIAPLLAAAFLFIYPGDYRGLFLLTVIPGLLAIIYVLKAVRAKADEAKQPEPEKEKIEFAKIKNLPKDFKVFLGVIFLFTLSLSTDAFLILKLHQTGVTTAWITVIWAAHNGVKMLSSFWGGRFADRVGHKTSIILGWILYSLVYFSFGIFDHPAISVSILLIYGIYYGLTESAEKALVVEMVSKAYHGTALGLYHLILGLGAVPAGILFGSLWQLFGPRTAFMISAFISILATALFSILVVRAAKPARTIA